jgi:starch-binding outer membrane protein, SusD/RagB family
MRLRMPSALVAVAISSLVTSSCTDGYFEGPRLNENPNKPSTAAADQQFVGFQAFTFASLTGDVNRVISLWMQQMAGTGRQWAGYDQYTVTENDFTMDDFYAQGGLVDIRGVASKVESDKLYLGIAQTWEALLMDMTSDVWGDIPYSQAVGDSIHPQLDPQIDVHNALLALADQGLTNINAGGTGPNAADLVYGGDKTKWAQAAHTLKARMYMHLGETDATSYAKALTETNSGISSAANDFTTYHSSTTGEANHWNQFRIQRGTDISAGKFLVDLMKQRNDPRLTAYFSPGASAGGQIIGARPGQEFDGSQAWLSATRGAAEFRQPLLTFAENQLIRAEAQFRTGAQPAALATLNGYRALVGLPALSGLAGAPLLTAILEEKYVALFQNTEVWNDYRRTCYPNLTPASGTFIPARLVYGTDERRANPNIPSPSQQPRRNQDDPPTTTSTDGSRCLGTAS